MDKEEKLKKLFREINEKPEGLDEKIMNKIYQEYKPVELSKNTDSRGELWINILLGFLILSGIVFLIVKVDFDKNGLSWLIGLSVLIPVVIDKLWSFQWARR